MRLCLLFGLSACILKIEPMYTLNVSMFTLGRPADRGLCAGICGSAHPLVTRCGMCMHTHTDYALYVLQDCWHPSTRPFLCLHAWRHVQVACAHTNATAVCCMYTCKRTHDIDVAWRYKRVRIHARRLICIFMFCEQHAWDLYTANFVRWTHMPPCLYSLHL